MTTSGRSLSMLAADRQLSAQFSAVSLTVKVLYPCQGQQSFAVGLPMAEWLADNSRAFNGFRVRKKNVRQKPSCWYWARLV